MQLIVLKKWIIIGIVIGGLSFLIYVCGQQILRMGANDPQIQYSEGWAMVLNTRKNPSEVTGDLVEIDKSLYPYIVVYDTFGKPVSGTGYLDGKLAQIPIGIFDYVRSHGQDRVTWQPRPGVRSAIVVTKYNDGFVMAGRSLRETEIREDNLLKIVAVGAVGLFLVTCLTIILIK
jgi:hypothetical protein